MMKVSDVIVVVIITSVVSAVVEVNVALVSMASCGGLGGGLRPWPIPRILLVVVGPRLTVQAHSVRLHVDRAHRVGRQRGRGGSRDLPVAPSGRDADVPLRPDPTQLRFRPRVPSPARQPVAPSPSAQGGRRPAPAPREALPLERGDVVAPAHHELLDLARVVRRPSGAVLVVASGLRPGLSLGIAAFSLPRSGKVQPERPRGADPEVTPWFHALGQKK